MDIPGFYYVPNYLTEDEINALTKFCTSVNMTPIGKGAKSRKVVQYGYSYAYDRSGVKPIISIPYSLKNIVDPNRINKAIGADIIQNKMEQLIINEYTSGQGISQHKDHIKYFGPVIICITIGSGIEINFMKNGQSIPKYVDVGSLYIMSGEARYNWTHGIAERIYDDDKIRGTRYSLTYRTVNDDIKKEVNTYESFRKNHKNLIEIIDKRYDALMHKFNKIDN